MLQSNVVSRQSSRDTHAHKDQRKDSKSFALRLVMALGSKTQPQAILTKKLKAAHRKGTAVLRFASIANHSANHVPLLSRPHTASHGPYLFHHLFAQVSRPWLQSSPPPRAVKITFDTPQWPGPRS